MCTVPFVLHTQNLTVMDITHRTFFILNLCNFGVTYLRPLKTNYVPRWCASV